MIKAEVRTVMEFSDEEEFRRYLVSDQQAIITGFADELREAFETGEIYNFATPRPEYGAVVVSEITVARIDKTDREADRVTDRKENTDSHGKRT